MTDSILVRLGIGSRLRLDGEVVEVIGLHDAHAVLRDGTGRVSSMALGDLLADRQRAQMLDVHAEPVADPAAIALSLAGDTLLEHASSRAAHVRELLTGYRSGFPELALPGEPRPQYAPGIPIMRRYVSKAAEIGMSESGLRKWVSKYQNGGEAALLQQPTRQGPFSNVDSRWLDTARAVLDELTGASTVSRKLVLQQIAERVERDHGPGTRSDAQAHAELPSAARACPGP